MSDDVASKAWTEIIDSLRPLEEEDKRRVWSSVSAFLRMEMPVLPQRARSQGTFFGEDSSPESVAFSEDTSMSPKEFFSEKQPKTGIERIACLAYYLTHYRDTPHFKTRDLTELNMEAAQPKFSSAGTFASNAVAEHYLVSSTKGNRQISAIGEQIVQALPDREAKKLIMKNFKPRKKNKKRQKQNKNKKENSFE